MFTSGPEYGSYEGLALRLGAPSVSASLPLSATFWRFLLFSGVGSVTVMLLVADARVGEVLLAVVGAVDPKERLEC